MNLNPVSDCEKNFILEAASQRIVSKSPTFHNSIDLFTHKLNKYTIILAISYIFNLCIVGIL